MNFPNKNMFIEDVKVKELVYSGHIVIFHSHIENV